MDTSHIMQLVAAAGGEEGRHWARTGFSGRPPVLAPPSSEPEKHAEECDKELKRLHGAEPTALKPGPLVETAAEGT